MTRLSVLPLHGEPIVFHVVLGDDVAQMLEPKRLEFLAKTQSYRSLIVGLSPASVTFWLRISAASALITIVMAPWR